jgi:hypothetical protein
MLYISLEDFPVEPSTAIVSPIAPRRVMEAKRVVFLPFKVSWNLKAHTFAFRRVTIKRRKRGM